MKNKKNDNRDEVKQLSDEEAEAASGGMKIITDDMPGWLQAFLRLFFNGKN